MINRIESDILGSNTFVVSNGKDCFIVDAGASVDAVKKLVNGQNVLGVFLTHGHFDHIYFLDEYLKEFNCTAYASEYAKEYFCDADKNLSSDFYGEEIVIKNLAKTRFLCGNGTLKVGDFEIDYFQLGGHSKGDMAFVFEKNLFVGDLILGDSIGRYDMYGGDKNTLLKSLDFLQKLDYQTMMCGHGEDRKKSFQENVIMFWKRYLSNKK